MQLVCRLCLKGGLGSELEKASILCTEENRTLTREELYVTLRSLRLTIVAIDDNDDDSYLLQLVFRPVAVVGSVVQK
jgi:hypothetical protein